MLTDRRALHLFAAVLLCLEVTGCSSGSKESKAVPPQYTDRGELPSTTLPYVEMSHPAAPSAIVKDISGTVEAGSWRWTGEHPTLKVNVPDVQGWRLVARYAVSEVTFRKTGPVKITYAVNGKDLGTEIIKTPGDRVFNQPVDAAILKTGENIISIHVHNFWTSPTDGAKLGIILTGAGLIRQ
ncbi:MAG TPA: hypothetical protein VEX68_13285 [Bryobacteraceae bacterium]|nr:hypothetical protein [Bryobacteraceae bacterium]